jgi:hypothetical protein
VKLKTIDDEGISFMANGHRLRLYHKPISREEFVLVILDLQKKASTSTGHKLELI